MPPPEQPMNPIATTDVDPARCATLRRTPRRVGRGRHAAAAIVLGLTTVLSWGATAAPTYLALGDSITFGETDLIYRQSYGDQGYVARYADALGAANGGARPNVINLAIDGETPQSLLSGVGRTPPVAGRTDVPLALQNLNYAAGSLVPQGTLVASTVAAQAALGNAITNVTISLGFNNLAALAPAQATPAAIAAAIAAIPATLMAYQAAYAAVLTEVRALAPGATLALLNYYNPFPADPASPTAPIFAAGGTQLNGIIAALARQFGAAYVDTFTPFVGNEALYTYQDDLPAGSSVPGAFGGLLPIGNVHPNTLGYDVIAGQVIAATVAVPEPGSLAILVTAVGALLAARRRRSRADGVAR